MDFFATCLPFPYTNSAAKLPQPDKLYPVQRGRAALATERHIHQRQHTARFFIRIGRRDDGDLHPADLID